MKNNILILNKAKVAYDVKVAGVKGYSKTFLTKFNEIFSLKKIPIGSGRMRIFGINVLQEKDKPASTNADD